jgi:hypothetical protein
MERQGAFDVRPNWKEKRVMPTSCATSLAKLRNDLGLIGFRFQRIADKAG